MRKNILAFGLLLALSACAAEEGGPIDEVSQALVTIDSSAVATAPAASLPDARLPAGAFAEGQIAANLMQTSEPLGLVRTVGDREIKESAGWQLERDALKGQFTFLRKLPPGAPAPQNEATLQQASLARLSAWGLPQGEVLKVLQRRALRQGEEGGAVGPPALHRYKTFVFRGIGGVRVEGHRAVLTHGPDGVLRRGLVRWPALAPSGHKLRTTLTRAQIVSRAQSALAAAGETDGRAVLSWKYVPTLTASGAVTLKLMVGARLAAVQGEITEEAREIDVDVSAQP